MKLSYTVGRKLNMGENTFTYRTVEKLNKLPRDIVKSKIFSFLKESVKFWENHPRSTRIGKILNQPDMSMK